MMPTDSFEIPLFQMMGKQDVGNGAIKGSFGI